MSLINKIPSRHNIIRNLYFDTIKEGYKLKDLLNDLVDTYNNNPMNLTKSGLCWMNFVKKHINE